MNSSLSMGKLVAIATLAFCAFIPIVGAISVYTANEGRVILGVQAMGTSLAGMKKEEAMHFFEKIGASRVSRMPILLEYKEKRWTIRPEDIHLAADAKDAAQDAYGIGRESTPFRNLVDQMRYAITGRSVELTADYDRQLLAGKLQDIANEINVPPSNASIDFQGDGSIRRIPAVIGKALDTTEIATALETQLVSLQRPSVITLEPKETFPAVVDEDLARIDSVLASYTTSFGYGNRGDNIVIAANRLNDILIRSGMVFSFNNTVGQRTVTAGYKDAPVIIDGKVEEDVGGGVCQVSSTLYNAVLLAGLTPTMRTPHFYPSSYCPPGRDATVADGLLDFQFKNQLPHSVYLLSRVYGAELTIYILGTVADLQGNTITLEQEGTVMQPTVYRIFSRNGTIIEREYMHTDSYSTPKED